MTAWGLVQWDGLQGTCEQRPGPSVSPGSSPDVGLGEQGAHRGLPSGGQAAEGMGRSGAEALPPSGALRGGLRPHRLAGAQGQRGPR